MPIFEYKGMGADGRALKGLQDAESLRVLKGLLRKEGVLLTWAEERAAGSQSRKGEVDLKRLFQRVNTLDIALMTRQLATLTKAGIPLVAALTAVIEQNEKTELKTALTAVRDQVNEGSTFAEALSQHPKLFPELYVNMVNAGEQSGTLDAVLARLADFAEAQYKLNGKVVGAMIYPMIMLLFGIIVIWVVMIAVVPKITQIFENFGRQLPWNTQLLIWLSRFMQGYWWLIILVTIGIVYGFMRWKRSRKGRERWDRFVLKAPIFGKLVMMLAISRFAKTLATLLASGVQLLKALDITKAVLGNLALQEVITEASESIREGESIADPLKRSGRFPPIVTHMIAIGEKSGQLEEMLENVAEAYDALVESRVSALTTMLEPVMIMLIGMGAAALVFSILMPLLQMNRFIQ